MVKTSKRQTSNASRRVTPEQIFTLASFIASVLLKVLSFDQAQYWLINKSALKERLYSLLDIVDPFFDLRQEWQGFYKDHFGIEVDFSSVVVPEKPSEGSWRLIFIAQGLTLNATLAVMRKKFKAWTGYSDDDLDKAVTKNARTSSQSYAIWVRDGVEPDDRYLGKSTQDADPDMKIGMTILERMVLELKYWLETGKHLDIKGVSFCTGSRTVDGDVPDVRWLPASEGVGVCGCTLDCADPRYGLREAVSAPNP